MDQLLELLSQLVASPTATAILTFFLTALTVKYPWLTTLLAFIRKVLVPNAPPAPPQPAVPQVPDVVPNYPLLNAVLQALLAKLLEKHKEQNPVVAVIRELDEAPPK